MTVLEPKEAMRNALAGTVPVIVVDESRRDSYGVEGTKVRLAYTDPDGGTMFLRAWLRTFNDTGYFQFYAAQDFLSEEHGYWDYVEAMEFGSAPVIRPGDTIQLCVVDSFRRRFRPPVLLQAGDRIRPLASAPLDLEPYSPDAPAP